jgi:hypothetical protein
MVSHGMDKKICKFCHREFIADKYHPHQQVCSSPECQHKRQLENQRKWRLKNPDYFKYKEKKTFWEKKRAQYLKIWRKIHRDYFRKYHRKRRRDTKTKVSFFP